MARGWACLVFLVGLAALGSATLSSALRVTALATDNCLSLTNNGDIWTELDLLLDAGADDRTVARALYALVGALRAGRPLCASVVSASNTHLTAVSAGRACRERLGPARGAHQFAANDPLIECLKVGYQRGGLIALVATVEEEDARTANAAAAAAAAAAGAQNEAPPSAQ
jgi:hypothetical protein